jgi:ubiquinone/menaquinone biosynthesis C-methylase UbiE
MTENAKQSVQESYDRLAEAYAHHFHRELEHKPLDRELLDRFAGSVRQLGEVCDMGCGPGHIARYLSDTGTTVFGLDLSPQMIAQARRLNPHISFREGDMTALDIPDDTLAGIAAFYSIVNMPKESLPIVFREMERVLQPGGMLLLSFHIGDEIVHPDNLLGVPVSMDFFFFQPASIRQYLEDARLEVEEIIERGPYAPEVEHQSRRAYVFARKPYLVTGR